MQGTDERLLDRRRLLLSGAGALGGLSCLTSHSLAALSACSSPLDGTLVLVQLSGGNDGLSTVVPHGDDAYHRSRQTTRIDPARVQKLDAYRGLHPELTRLRSLFGDGRLAIVEGVGYADPNRSHFKSFEIWHTADPRGRASGDGWIGRLCEVAFADDVHPNRVVHVGARVPYSLYSSKHPPASFSAPAGYRWVRNEDTVRGLGWEFGRGDGSILGHLRAKMRAARESSGAIRAAVARYRTPIVYPREPFAEYMKLRVCSPSPQISTLVPGGASATLRQTAAGAFSRPPRHVPNGP